jgi:Fe-S oxidoreductase
MAKPKLKPCPFCNTDYEVRLETEGQTNAFVMCHACVVRGPYRINRRRAIRAWNNRPAEKKNYSKVYSHEFTNKGFIVTPIKFIMLPNGKFEVKFKEKKCPGN